MEHQGEMQRQTHEVISYRGGKILVITHKSPDSSFWTAHVYVSAVDGHGNHIFHDVADTVDKFAKEEDAKNELIEAGKRWIDSQLA